MRVNSLRSQVLIPLTLALALLIALFVVVISHFQKQHIDQSVSSRFKSIQRLFAVQLDNDAAMMDAALCVIIRDERIKAALKKKDRNALLQEVSELYAQLHAQHRITHFYFSDAEKTNILRVHLPDRYGDKIDRITTQMAERSGKPSHGIELGPMGTFTLRTVHPWYESGRLLGYVELGEEIEHITQKLSGILGVDLFIFIEKRYLERASWESSMQTLGRSFNWDQFPSFAMAYHTSPSVPSELVTMMTGEKRMSSTVGNVMESNGLTYRVASLPLKDAGNRQIGQMVITQDITDLTKSLYKTIFLTSGISLAIGGILFFLFYVYVGRVEKQMEQANRALRESEEKYRNILNNIEDSYLEVNLSGHFTYANPAAVRLLGYSAEELRNAPFQMAAEPSQLSTIYNTFSNIYKTGQPGRNLLFDVITKSGQRLNIEMSVSLMTNATGEPVGFFGIGHDMTERRRMEEALKEAKEKADEANKAKSEFLASMSHEIRTPMNAIIGMAELLAETEMTEDQRQYVQIFRSAGENLLDLINDILDLSKVEAGHMNLEYVQFNLYDLVEKACDMIAMRAHKKGLELANWIMSDVPGYLVGDPVRLRQIMINLLGNAVKFTEAGEIVLQVIDVTPRADAPGKEAVNRHILQFSVRDTGIGIPPEKIDKVFDLFSQADSSTTRQYGGTGLGLTISKRLVELMGGRIWLESETGRGTTVYFTVPFSVGIPNEEPISSVVAMNLKGQKILIIDDNATNRLILRDYLTREGALITESVDGLTGLEALREADKSGRPFALILLDNRMPGMDGFDVAHEISRDPRLAGTTIMMLTSENRPGDLNRAKNMGISEYLSKPIKRMELDEAIHRAIRKTERKEVMRSTDTCIETGQEGNLRILLVEDSDDNRLLIQAYLKKLPYVIDVAENGEKGVARFKECIYALVLMDMQMPVMDGYTATRQIREWEVEKGVSTSGRTPIIALTAYALKEDTQKSLDAGCDAHLSKPIKKETLLETMRRYIRPSDGE